MYQFWYDHLKNKCKVELIYTDTNSFIIQVETDYIYKDILEIKIYMILVNIQKITLIMISKIKSIR